MAEIRKSKPDSDGDGLPDGNYTIRDGVPVRIGDVPELKRYRGVRNGLESDLDSPLGEHVDSDVVRFNGRPGIYTTTDPNVALTSGAPEDSDDTGMLYEVTLTPTELLNVPEDCNDFEKTRLAEEHGFDALDCPTSSPHPETISFHPDQIEVDETTRLDAIQESITTADDNNQHFGEDYSRVKQAADEYRNKSDNAAKDFAKSFTDKSTRIPHVPKRPGRGRLRI